MKHYILITTILLVMVGINNSYAQESKEKSSRKELREQKKAEKELRREEQKIEKELRKEEQKAEKERAQDIKSQEKEAKRIEQESKKQERRDLREKETQDKKQNKSTLKQSDVTVNENTQSYKNENIGKTIKESTNSVQKYDNSQSSDKIESNKDDNDNSLTILKIIGIVIVLSIIFQIISFFQWIYSKRCKKCGRFWAMREVGESKYLGPVREEKKKDSNGNIYKVFHREIGYTCQCKHCGYEEYRTRIE